MYIIGREILLYVTVYCTCICRMYVMHGLKPDQTIPTPNPEKLYKYHSVAKTTETCFRMLDTLQRGVQWMGGAVDWGSII